MPYTRNIKKNLEEALDFSPVVLLIGARQTGKSTLIREIAEERGYSYYTFDNLSLFASAKKDPEGFISGLTKPAILDEVQRIPEIFLPIKLDLEDNRIAGRYALTGSANPLLLPTLGDSLAGRMSIFELYPLSQGELVRTKEDFIALVYGDNQPAIQKLSRKELIPKMMVGGFPTVQGATFSQRELWFDDYIRTILTREVTDLSRIEGILELPQLMQLLAARAGTMLNVSDLSRKINVAAVTLRRYIALLKAVFMISFIQPWGINLGKRVARTPKVFLVDTGLLCHIIGINEQRLTLDPTLTGQLFENFVMNELQKQLTWSSKKATLYYFRTHDNIEVDFVLEDTAGNIVGIEVKAADSVSHSDFKGLKYLQEQYPDRFVKGILLYTGTTVIPFGKKLFAWPLSSLWSSASL